MIIPPNNEWIQTNKSDKTGSLAYSKNINLDEYGYLKLSPRSVNIIDDTVDADFNIPVAFGRSNKGEFYIATTEEPFNLSISSTALSVTEDATSNNPTLSFNSHGRWWQNRFYESTSTAVSYNSAGTWTANAITGLSSSYRHVLEVFRNRKTLCVSNGNTVAQYDTSHSTSGIPQLTIPSDYEVIGMAYNNYRMGIITRLGTSSSGQNASSYFFVWNGATTEASDGVSIGAYSAVAIAPYKGTWVVLDSAGQLKLYNGGGFDVVATFPFYTSESSIGDLLNFISYGDNIVVDGDVIYININFNLSAIGIYGQNHIKSNPSGVWCYDPEHGLYHRWSMSNSKAYFHNITSGNVNTTTDIFTTSATIPTTGNPVIYTSGSTGGLVINKVYYVIKHTSTTFSLAETKEDATDGNKVDITGASANQYFLMIDVIDYGASYNSGSSGALALYGTQTNMYTDILFGGRILDTALSAQPTLCSVVPLVENRGYVVLPKIYSKEISDTFSGIYIKHRPLNTDDKIIVKVKTRDIFGLINSTPSLSPTNATTEFTWTGTNTGTTTANLEIAKNSFDAGVELECEFTSGIGAGQMVKISNITESSGTYTITLDENVAGATSSLKSNFIIENWKTLGSVNSTTQNDTGVVKFVNDAKSKWAEYKIELRGYQTTIEELQTINQAFKQAV